MCYLLCEECFTLLCKECFTYCAKECFTCCAKSVLFIVQYSTELWNDSYCKTFLTILYLNDEAEGMHHSLNRPPPHTPHHYHHPRWRWEYRCKPVTKSFPAIVSYHHHYCYQCGHADLEVTISLWDNARAIERVIWHIVSPGVEHFVWDDSNVENAPPPSSPSPPVPPQSVTARLTL